MLDLSVMHEINTVNGVNIARPFLDHPKKDIYDLAHNFMIPYFLDTTPDWSNRGKMRRKKLGIYGITLVILAGLFQLITLSLDQVVIQLEEDNRIISDKISKKNKEKEFALENNRRIGEIIRSSHFQSLIISSFDFENQYLEYGNYMKTYFSRNSMKSNKNVLRDVLYY